MFVNMLLEGSCLLMSYSTVNVFNELFQCSCLLMIYVNVNVNICNALEFPKKQKCRYLLWSIEAKMVQVCFEL